MKAWESKRKAYEKHWKTLKNKGRHVEKTEIYRESMKHMGEAEEKHAKNIRLLTKEQHDSRIECLLHFDAKKRTPQEYLWRKTLTVLSVARAGGADALKVGDMVHVGVSEVDTRGRADHPCDLDVRGC